MQISIIKKSDVQETRRFDAEFFKPEYLEIKENQTFLFVISKWNGAKRSGMRNRFNVENRISCGISMFKRFFAYGLE